MPYCPECGYEYTPGVRTCPDCQATLTQEVVPCASCEELIDPKTSFCRHCGVFRPEGSETTERVTCEKHKERRATGRCVFCGKPVCDECAVIRNGRIFCDNDEHVKMMSDWVTAYSTSTQYEAQMIKSNLEGAGIPAVVFSQNDRMYFTTVGDLAVTEVMVPKHFLDDARRYLETMERDRPHDQPEA